MRAAAITFVILSGLIAAQGISVRGETRSGSDGMSVAEFRDLADSLPKLPGRIQAIRLFRASGSGQAMSAALATFSERTGWQILVFGSPVARKFRLEWRSGKLDDSFSVSDPSALEIFHLGQQDAVVFEGCAPHVCPDVFSILMYVPSRLTAFTANYVWGKITYSPVLDSPADVPYKSALDQLISEHRNR